MLILIKPTDHNQQIINKKQFVPSSRDKFTSDSITSHTKHPRMNRNKLQKIKNSSCLCRIENLSGEKSNHLRKEISYYTMDLQWIIKNVFCASNLQSGNVVFLLGGCK